MSASSNIGRADVLSAGRCTAPNAPVRGGKPGILFSHICAVLFGGGDRSPQGYSAPAAADPDGICVAQAKATAGALVLDGVTVVDGVAVLNPPRNVTIDTSNVGNTTQVVTITGLDPVGNAVTQELTCNGTTEVVGEKLFSQIDEISISAGLTAGNIFVGFGLKVGMPFKIDSNSILVVQEDGAASTGYTVNSQTNGNMGSIEFETPPDGSIEYLVVAWVWDTTESAYVGFSPI
jgi:hypothetical protein